jgi:hypothetical protein
VVLCCRQLWITSGERNFGTEYHGKDSTYHRQTGGVEERDGVKKNQQESQ